MTDREKALAMARSFIGKTGKDICCDELHLGMVVDWCAYALSAIMKKCGFIGKYQGGIYGFASDAAREDSGKLGIWFKKGAKTPQPGDYIMFRYASFLNPIDKFSDLSSTDVYSFYRPNWKNESTSSGTAAGVSKDTASKPTVKKSVDVIAREVIAGKWGAGEERKKKLTAAGYNYSAVQQRVNELMSAQPKKTVEQVAREVIAGKWGVGQDRYNRLTKAGYDYNAVQRKVNQLLR